MGDGARDALLGQAWPGNVRELKNMMERCALFCAGRSIAAADLGLAPATATALPAARNLDEPSLDTVAAALAATDGVVARAAQRLGLSRQALYRRMEHYGLLRDSDRA